MIFGISIESGEKIYVSFLQKENVLSVANFACTGRGKAWYFFFIPIAASIIVATAYSHHYRNELKDVHGNYIY